METYTKLAMVAFLIATSLVSGPTQVDGQSVLCGMTFDSIMSCKPAVVAENPLPPTELCCTALKSADISCLCKFKKNNMLGSFGVDPTQALQLPIKCNLLKSVPCV